MLKKLIAVFLMASLGQCTPVFAEPAPGGASQLPFWCVVNTTVDGDPHHFFVTGYDAWTGKGKLVCYSSEREHTQEVTIAFKSFNRGYGAGYGSKLRVNITLWTKEVPFRFLQLVSGLMDNSLVHWQFTNDNVEIIGTVWTYTQFNAASSLTLGELSVAPVVN